MPRLLSERLTVALPVAVAMAFLALLAFPVAAAQLLPTLESLRLSTRAAPVCCPMPS